MIGMDMRLDRIFEPQSELAKKLEVALDRLKHGVDERGAPGFRTADQIGVGRGLRLEQLPEHHRALAPLP